MKALAMTISSLVTVSAITLSGLSMAGDIAIDVRSVDAQRNTDGGFLELGVSVNAEQRLIVDSLDSDDVDDVELNVEFSVSAGFRYKNIFIEGAEDGFDGLNLGITLAETEHWDFDLLLANINGSITIESDEPPAPETESERNEAILTRDSLYIAAGPRLTGYFGDTLVQFRLVDDWFDGNGSLGSARAGRQWQLGNWNLQAIVGARYYSQQFSDYLYGITAEEQSDRFPQYSAGNAWVPEAEIGVSAPIAQDWVYRSRLRYRQYPDSVTDSPLTVRDHDVIFTNGIHYVF